ncbi:MAG: PilW family protein [Candidatus Omnitrophota bacterium]
MRNDQSGFSLVELMVVITVTALLGAGTVMLFNSGKETWLATESHVRVQENARVILERMAKELRQSDSEHIMILDGLGSGGSDIIQFKIPVTCSAGETTLCQKDYTAVGFGADKACSVSYTGTCTDCNDCAECDPCIAVCEWSDISAGENVVWGAPLTWGCEDQSCMDADGLCDTEDYSYLQYRKSASGQGLRQVYDAVADDNKTYLRQDKFGTGITDLQFSLDGNILTITVDIEQELYGGRRAAEQVTASLYLRN